jgi:hypothetical protein
MYGRSDIAIVPQDSVPGWRYRPAGGRVWPTLPPIWVEPDDEPVEEASQAKRISQARKVGKVIRREKASVEARAVSRLLARLKTLRREIAAALVHATNFRQSQLAALVQDIDARIAASGRAILADAHGSYQLAADLGAAQADETVAAANLTTLHVGPAASEPLVTAAFDNTADLLSSVMTPFRTAIVSNVRRIALGVDEFGANLAALARDIAIGGLDNPEYRAERVLRTEVGRTFNAATFARASELGREMPFLRKIWLAANDNRTRDTHRQASATYARGKGIPIGDKFAIGLATMRFPIDPLAQPAGKIAARETINCRCNAAIDFDAAALAAWTAQRVSRALSA